MNIPKSILAGITGTIVMTAFIYLISFITGKRFKVVKILGTMITGQTTPNGGLSGSNSAILTGLLVHYLVGIVFSLIYYWLWSKGIGNPGLNYCLLFGIITGILAVCIWRVFFVLHPYPPRIKVPAYLFVIFWGHVFFALGVHLIYLLSFGN
ncbi:MAG: hypothetical protein JWM28_214 [Chitinophagaceae bacterium]|nr:hypothetical protein [Chitinophagaceae bacterium]